MKWQVVQMHGFSVNRMYSNNHHRTRRYNDWIDETLYKMNHLESLEELNIDATKPMKIEIIFKTIRGFDIDNLIKSFLDTLVKYYGLADDNNFVDIHIKRDSSFIQTLEEGTICFAIENCEGCILNEIDKAVIQLKNKMKKYA